MKGDRFGMRMSGIAANLVLKTGGEISRMRIGADFKGDNETYIEGPTGNDDIILYDNQMRDRPRTRRTKRNV